MPGFGPLSCAPTSLNPAGRKWSCSEFFCFFPAWVCSFSFSIQGLDEKDEERKMENLYTGQGVGADPEEEGDDDEDEVDGNVSKDSS